MNLENRDILLDKKPTKLSIIGLSDEIIIRIICNITNINDLINFIKSDRQFQIIFKNYSRYILNNLLGNFPNCDVKFNFSQLSQFNWFNNCQMNGLTIEPFIKISFLNHSHNHKFGKFIYLNIFGEVKLIITEYEYTQLVNTELTNFIKHTQEVSKNDNIIYPQIPRIPNKLELNKDYLIDSQGTIFYILTFKHSRPNCKFINLVNEKSYFMILDSDSNIWCNPYDKLLSPIVCLDYNFQNRELSIREDRREITEKYSDRDSINPVDLKISINSKYDYCKLLNQEYFIVFKNGLRVHHETYEPYIMNKTDMRPCVVSTAELSDKHEFKSIQQGEILDFELIHDYLVFISTSNHLLEKDEQQQQQQNLILNYLRFDTEFSYELKSIVYEFKINEFKSQIILNGDTKFKNIIPVSKEFFMIYLTDKLILYKINNQKEESQDTGFKKDEIELIKSIEIPVRLSELIFKVKSNYESNTNSIKIDLILQNGALINFKIFINKSNEIMENLSALSEFSKNNRNIIDYHNGITISQIVN